MSSLIGITWQSRPLTANGRGDDTHIDLVWLIGPETLDFAVLQGA